MFIPFEDNEEIIAKVHRHWIFIAMRIAVLLALLAAPLVIIPFFERLGFIEISLSGFGAAVTLWALWGLLAWAIFWQFWTTYYMDIWVVTNRRVIDIDYERLFDRQISILRLDRVQDVATRVRGIFGTLFRYGSVIVQTAGTQDVFVIDQISDPEKLRDTILKVVSDIAGKPQKVQITQ